MRARKRCATCTRPTSQISSLASGPMRSRSSRPLLTLMSYWCPSAAEVGRAGSSPSAMLCGLKTRIIGVGAQNADAVARSWRTGTRIVGDSANTFAEGVATRVTFDLTFGILQRGLDDFVSLSEAQLAEGVRARAGSDAQPG